MHINTPLQLLGNITPAEFMATYWQKKPLLVRGALSKQTLHSLPSREALSAMACKPDAAARLIHKGLGRTTSGWSLTHSPLKKLPSAQTPNWTALVQGVDVLDAATHELLKQFRFIPDARLDDAMFSFATPGGGVGPHFDSYDVFLLQTNGSRQWAISAQRNLTLVEDVPLKILADFKPTKKYILEAGDMLYLPPRYAHEGVAITVDCITCSIGFRAPKKIELARELMDRLSEDLADRMDEALLYTDKHQSATDAPAHIPDALHAFAHEALQAALGNKLDLQIHLGEYLTEPKPEVWFQASEQKIVWSKIQLIQLNAATRMMFDSHHLFINGESFAASGPDAKLMRKLANERKLLAADLAKASSGARELLTEWLAAGWCHV
ncbi:MAG: cupin domain-containing protein [Cytophagales bacterium]|nr:cupin domain-containing protein [Cytophagales bacterium]